MEGSAKPAAKKRAAKKVAVATKRVVLGCERVLVLGDGVTLADVAACGDEKALRKLLVSVATTPATFEVDAWVVLGEFDGHSKQNAIEAYAGKPNTPEAKPGIYKAPGVAAWAGGRRYVKPPETKVEAEDIL